MSDTAYTIAVIAALWVAINCICRYRQYSKEVRRLNGARGWRGIRR